MVRHLINWVIHIHAAVLFYILNKGLAFLCMFRVLFAITLQQLINLLQGLLHHEVIMFILSLELDLKNQIVYQYQRQFIGCNLHQLILVLLQCSMEFRLLL